MVAKVKAGYKQTEVGVIPEDWEVKKISDVCTLINGRGFKPYEWRRSGLPIIRIQNLNGSEEFNYFQGDYNQKIEVERGQLLFAWSGSKGTSFGPHIWHGSLGLLNYHTWKVVINNEIIDKDYLFYILKLLTKFIESNAHGASALVHTQKWEMEGFSLQVPNKTTEQSAIAEALSDTDTLIESLNKLIEKKKMIKQGAMQELLTGKRRLLGFRGEWMKLVLSKFLSIPVTDGPHLTPKFLKTGIPFLSVNNLVDNKINWQSLRYISKEDDIEFSKKCKPKRNDILLGKAATVGTVAIVENDYDFNIWSPLALIRVKDHYFAKYFYYCLQTEFLTNQILFFTNSSSQGNVGMRDIRKLIFYMPPTKEEQEAIAKVLSEMDDEIELLEKKRDKYKHIKQGMMQELLTGRIRLI